MKRWLHKRFALMVLPLLAVSTLAGCGTKADTSSVATGNSSAAASTESDAGVTVNIGTQSLTGPIYLAEKKGWFEQAFAKVGAKVRWTQFTSGPPFFPAIASNHLDFGEVGNAPVLVGQAANVDFKEISVESSGKEGDAILVPKGSPIHSLKDLKGKEIAVAQGSSAYNFLYKALEKVGLTASQIHIVQLQPNEAQPAFASHAVDAWATWDPYITEEVQQQGAVELANEQTLGTADPGFTIVRTKFAEEHPDLVVLYLQVYQKALDWQNEHMSQAVQLYAQSTHLSPSVVKQMIINSDEENVPISNAIIQEQQQTADFLYSQKALAAKINVSTVVDNSYIDKALKEKSSQ